MKHPKRLCLILVVILAASAIGFGLWRFCAQDPGLTKTYEVSLSDGEIVKLSDTFRTNSTKISVSTPKGQPDVTVYLYNTDYEAPIGQHDLRAGETVTFSGLTSRFLYAVGIQPMNVGATADIILEIQYLPIT